MFCDDKHEIVYYHVAAFDSESEWEREKYVWEGVCGEGGLREERTYGERGGVCVCHLSKSIHRH